MVVERLQEKGCVGLGRVRGGVRAGAVKVEVR